MITIIHKNAKPSEVKETHESDQMQTQKTIQSSAIFGCFEG